MLLLYNDFKSIHDTNKVPPSITDRKPSITDRKGALVSSMPPTSKPVIPPPRSL